MHAHCVTLQELANCESDVTDEWCHWWVGNRMLVSNLVFETTGGRFCILIKQIPMCRESH